MNAFQSLLKAYADQPGTGPKSETCNTCKHLWSQRYGKRRVFKCYLLVNSWTFRKDTDVSATSVSCSKWVAKALPESHEVK